MSALKSQLGNITLWVVLWLVFWGGYFYFYHPVRFAGHPHVVALYFFAAGVIALAIFKEHFLPLLKNITRASFYLASLFLLLRLCFYVYAPYVIPEPTEYISRHPYEVFLQRGAARFFITLFEIFFQQIFVVALVMFLKEAGLPLSRIMLCFAAIFGAAHTPLVIIAHGFWSSWYFLGFSVVSAFVFPPFILKVRSGFVYSYIAHWIFYTASAVGFWVWYSCCR